MTHTASQEKEWTKPEAREEQKRKEHGFLVRDHEAALAAYKEQREAREKRRAEALVIHVTCMDERDTFAGEAIGEPLGAAEMFASPGGKVTVDDLLRLYSSQIEVARAAKKEVVIYLMPHKCLADTHAGCAAFKADEKAQVEYFSTLADALKARAEFFGVKIITAFYDTDTHQVESFHAAEIPKAAIYAQNRLREQRGVAQTEGEAALDQAHAGNRIYIGAHPRAWTARRNVAYHLHSGMEKEALLEGIALAIKVMKTHSHADLTRTPVVLQLDRSTGQEFELDMTDQELMSRLNASPLLQNIELTPEELLVIRTETDAKTWEGREVEAEEMREAA